ncbi:hypothetical protein I6F30_36805 [Bradyrhizobium sp. NBAIM20]|uniref:hypothetical protein n=1 Tax=unclassified Bradyrhizobium TaxID=2631580 RepID=UPI001CD25B45|nr:MULTISPECIES: hypothetical protein [unclassified Bradyrhizobium]MCA1416643.1 hypothetical protein [Bradyrhizobium sp. NBAIM20]MCA1459560.1 hypothetical protein [Bradyrhizobium sp. NBAIM18]
MTNEAPFRTSDEEIERLLEECGELKRTLKSISSQLSRMENRIKAAFPVAAKKIKEQQQARSVQRESTLSADQAVAEFDKIVQLASSGATSEAETYLARRPSADLLAIAREVGVTFPSTKPSVRAMLDAILGKVRESLLLSRHSRRE